MSINHDNDDDFTSHVSHRDHKMSTLKIWGDQTMATAQTFLLEAVKHTKEYDVEMAKLYCDDALDAIKVASLLYNGDLKSAERIVSRLDTEPREAYDWYYESY